MYSKDSEVLDFKVIVKSTLAASISDFLTSSFVFIELPRTITVDFILAALLVVSIGTGPSDILPEEGVSDSSISIDTVDSLDEAAAKAMLDFFLHEIGWLKIVFLIASATVVVFSLSLTVFSTTSTNVSLGTISPLLTPS